jgi:5'-nucleotidase/UDP-sugar diphosphatase
VEEAGVGAGETVRQQRSEAAWFYGSIRLRVNCSHSLTFLLGVDLQSGIPLSRLGCVIVCAVAVLCGSALVQGQSSLRKLTILHTNDLHASLQPVDGIAGFAHLATAIRHERAASEAVLHLDGGDLVQGTPVSTIFEGVPIFEFANEFGIDVAVLGNHEFDYGWQRIDDFRNAAKFPLIAANVVNDAGQMLTPPGYVIKEVGGVRVGIIGVTTQQTNDIVRPRHLGPWRVAPVVPVVAQLARILKPKMDLVMVLGHLDHAEDAAILEQVPDVAFVISGHNHSGLEVPRVVGGRFAVKARSNGRELGRLDLDIDTLADRVVQWRWKTIPITTGAYPADSKMAALVEKWEGEVATVVDVPIGTARTALSGDRLRHLLERAIADEAGADLAYINPGGIRAQVPAGTILARHIWNVLPFDNAVVVAEVKGADLPDPVKKEQQIDPDRVYRFATFDFLAETEFAPLRLRWGPPGKQTRDLAIEWIRKQTSVIQ